MKSEKRIALTGFMGVGKSSVARHLSHFLECPRIDLDIVIEKDQGRSTGEIIDQKGEEQYRKIETELLRQTISDGGFQILSLGGGTWMRAENRDILREEGLISIWLEATFSHCWNNIQKSRKVRPLSRDKEVARKLFNDREKIYCLADWHFVIKPGATSYDVAKQIFEEVF